MKILHAIMTGMALAYAGIYANAQSAVDSVKVTYKDKTVVVRSQGDESKTSIHFNDSLTGKKILVKVQFEDDLESQNNVRYRYHRQESHTYDASKELW